MLQCGLVRSNFALAIHIHLCRRAPRGHAKPRLVYSKNGSVQAGNSAPISRVKCLSRHRKQKNNRETFDECPGRARTTHRSTNPAVAGRQAAGAWTVACPAAGDV